MAVVSTGQITITDVNDYTYQGTTAPKNPIPNVTVWIDTSVSPSVMKRWTGTAWEIVNEVVVGGRNLILGTKDGNGWFIPNSDNTYIGSVANGLFTLSASIYHAFISPSIFLPPNETFTLSFNVVVPNNYTVQLRGTDSSNAICLDKRFFCDTGGKKVFTITTPSNIHKLDVRFFAVNSSTPCSISNLKLERGNKATDWTPAPEDVDSAISTAQNSANAANNLLADISNDNILSPSEKQSTKKEWDIIVSEKSVVESQANTLGVSTTSYTNAYNSLNSYVSPLLANLTVNSTIVGSDFRAKFKNYYDAKIALLKAVTDKLKSNTDDIQVGGRNLLRNSGKFQNTDFWTNYTSTSFVLNNNRLIVTNGSTGVPRLRNATLIPLTDSPQKFTVTVEYISEHEINLTGKSSDSLTIGNELGSQIIGVVEKIKTTILESPNRKITEFRWTSLVKGTALSSWLMFSMPVNTVFEIINVKVEKGNKATDWTPAPEDVQLQIDSEAAKVINLENKTDFLTGTTIEGNAVATGTLLVGNSDGTNAGITGLGSTSDGVYLWGGGTYQQMVQGLAKKEQRRNGIDIWRHPNGQIGFEIGIKDGRLIFNGYHSSGFKLFELDPNRGLVNVSYTQESWTETPFRKLSYSSSTYNESTITNEIKLAIIKQSKMEYYTPPNYNPDSEFGYITTYSLTQNAVGYDYDNGTNPANSSYESLKGMKANYGDRNTNMSNGWYMSDIGEIHMESEWNNYPPLTYTFTVYVYYYQDGKITQTKVVTITK